MRALLLTTALLLSIAATTDARPIDTSKAPGEVMMPAGDPPRLVYEGFETSVPPPGWTAVQTNVNETWLQNCIVTPYEGTYLAACMYDAAYWGPQDEHICFDHTMRAGDERLFFYAHGSTYWAIDPYQNYNFMVTIDGSVVWDYRNDNDGAVTWQWQLYDVDLAEYTTGQTVTICLVYEGYDGAQASFDALYIGGQEGPPETCCPLPGSACEVIDFGITGGGAQLELCEGGLAVWGWEPDPEVPSLSCDGVPVTSLAGTTIGATYPSLAGEIIYFGPFSITSDCWCLELCHYYRIESGYDGGNVRVSDDQGATWTVVRPDEGYDDVLDSVSYPAVCVHGEEVFTGASDGFVMDCFNLSTYEGSDVLIGFAFGSDSSDVSRGWYVRSLKLGGGSTAVEHSSWGGIKALYR